LTLGGESVAAEIKGETTVREETRKNHAPGRAGEFPYARAAYSYFDEILELRADGFSLATVRKVLEARGVLPEGADRRSFCRAVRHESARRARAEMSRRKGAASGEEPRNEEARGYAAGRERTAPPGAAVAYPDGPESGAGLRINPDNTFTIKPIDPDDLPDNQQRGEKQLRRQDERRGFLPFPGTSVNRV
jgi:DNA-binding transcriptional MerR regulator